MRLRLNVVLFLFLLSYLLNANAVDVDTQVTPSKQAFPLQQTDCQFSGTFEQVKELANIDDGLPSSGVFFHHCQYGVIWSTFEPVLETLIMRRDGSGFLFNEQGLQKLKSRQGKFLSKLLNALMSGDQTAIEQQFELTADNGGGVILTPKKRSLKRAIKSINVQRSAAEKNVNITFVDRNLQVTKIKSKQKSTFSDDNIRKNCALAIEAMANKTQQQSSCERLLQNQQTNDAQ